MELYFWGRINVLLDKLKEFLTEYLIITINKQNYTQFIEIYNSNDEYFMLADGEKACMESCLEDLEAIPPNFNIEKKIFIGFWKNNKAIAILDLLEGYPDSNCCWIGLLLVHQETQGKRIGREIINAVVKAAQSKCYSYLQLGVIDTNKKALIFWDKCGFIKTRVKKVKRDDKADWNIIVMEKKME